MEHAMTKPRIYLRKIQPMKKGLASEETMMWIWMGGNPVGEDWSLGSVRLITLPDAIKAYARRVRAAANHGAPLREWLAGRCE
jgi:hypothetical protein